LDLRQQYISENKVEICHNGLKYYSTRDDKREPWKVCGQQEVENCGVD